ncbi:MAG TPA: hypothetical protein VKC56_07280 [Gallionellaceae bacterium]|nr:hypothetical protein [Gallionellaceae bacterium]
MQTPPDFESVVSELYDNAIRKYRTDADRIGLDFAFVLRVALKKSDPYTLAEAADPAAGLDELLAELRTRCRTILGEAYREANGDLARAVAAAKREVARLENKGTEIARNGGIAKHAQARKCKEYIRAAYEKNGHKYASIKHFWFSEAPEECRHIQLETVWNWLKDLPKSSGK